MSISDKIPTHRVFGITAGIVVPIGHDTITQTRDKINNAVTQALKPFTTLPITVVVEERPTEQP